MSRTLTLAATAALLLAPALGAQAPRPDTTRPRVEGRRSMMGPGMMRERRGATAPRGRGPAVGLLAMRHRLQLTDEQVRRLEALSTSYREPRPDEAALLRARADLLEATRKDDVNAARAAMERMSRLRTDAAVARLQAGKSAREVLTAEQRTQLQALRDEVRTRRGAMRGAKGARGARGMRGAQFAPRQRMGGREMRMREGRPPMTGPARLAPRPPVGRGRE